MHAIAKEPILCNLSIENNTINQVLSFEQLGCKTTSSDLLENEVIKQAHKAAVMTGHLRYPIWRNKHLSTHCKSRIHKAKRWQDSSQSTPKELTA